MPQTYQEMNYIGALDEKYLTLLFHGYFTELFPCHLFFPMMDAFLLEGNKVLLRYALALIQQYKKEIKQKKFLSGKEFWVAIKADAFASALRLGQTLPCRLLGIEETLLAIDQFALSEMVHSSVYFDSNHIAKMAFELDHMPNLKKWLRPLNIRRNHLELLKKKAISQENSVEFKPEIVRKSSISVSKGHESFMMKKNSISRLSPSRTNSLSMVKSVSLDDADDNDDPSFGLTYKLSDQSSILDVNKAEKLVSLFSSTLITKSLVLKYSSDLHGMDMSHFYRCIEQCSPVILLIQLLDPSEDLVIGAINQGPLSPINNVVRGDGKTSVVFSLNSNTAKAYPWCHLQHPEEALQSSIETNYFAYATSNYLVFGASREHSTNAIRLDEDFRVVHTGFSDTYQNPPLVSKHYPQFLPNENISSLSFDQPTEMFRVKCIEVFST